MSQWYQILTRKKQLDETSGQDSKLGKVLNTLDLTFLGVAGTLGVGVYVLAGHVARDTAGPSVVLSFVIAAFASIFAGLCYAEFGARVPNAGSAYAYSYVTIGEFVAFIIGWNLLLEYIIGSASVAKGLTMYLDSLLNNTMRTTFQEIAPTFDTTFTSDYFDLFSFAITLLLGVGLAFGLKESKWINNIFTLINVFVVIFVIIAGAINAKTSNWSLEPRNGDKGGFFPFGFSGTIKGAATCFYGFVGFDAIATTGEEVKNPKRAIPISILLSLVVVCIAYCGTATVVTLMIPYYDQDPNAPIPNAFETLGLTTGKWIVSIGGIFGLLACLFASMFPLPRIIYAMASDSLIFRFLGNVNKRFKTPVVGTLLAAFLTGLMSAIFKLEHLVNMMSIGTLMAYTIVAACVLLLRYEDVSASKYSLLQHEDSENDSEYNGDYGEAKGYSPDECILFQIFDFRKRDPSRHARSIISIQVVVFCLLAVLFGACMKFFIDDMVDLTIWPIVTTSVVGLLIILVVVSIAAQPTSKKELSFKVPWVPIIPAVSILINVYLMFMLDAKTWIRFGVWMAVGLPIYLSSACCLYKPSKVQPTSKVPPKIQIQNGTINYAYENEETVQELTIPEIVVQPSTPKVFQENTETKEKDISTPKKIRVEDSDTESESSEEHFVHVEVHRENEPQKDDLALQKTEPAYIPVYFNFYTDKDPIPEDINGNLELAHPKEHPETKDSFEKTLEVKSREEKFEILKEISIEHIQIYLDSLENSSEVFLPPKIEEKLHGFDRETIEAFIHLECTQNHSRDLEMLKKIPVDHLQSFIDSLDNPDHILDIPKETVELLRNINLQTIREFLEKEDSFSDEAVLEALNQVISEEEERQLAMEERRVLEIFETINNPPEQDDKEKGSCSKDTETGECFKNGQEETEIPPEVSTIPLSPPLPPEGFLDLFPLPKVQETPPTSTEKTPNDQDSNIPLSPPLPPVDFLVLPEILPQIKKSKPPVEKLPGDGVIPLNPEDSAIPVPPPMQLPTPEIERKPLVPINQYALRNVTLKKVEPPQEKLPPPPDFCESEDNVKSGTKAFDRIKEKLNDVFKNYNPILPNPERNSPQEEKTPEDLIVPNRTVEEVPDIPENYAKTIDFKKKLGHLILKNSFRDPKKKALEAPDQTKVEEIQKRLNNLIHKETSEVSLRKPSEEDSSEAEPEIKIPKNVQRSLEEHNQEHRKKMLATLRSIKLRSTPNLEETFGAPKEKGHSGEENKVDKEGKKGSHVDSPEESVKTAPNRTAIKNGVDLPQLLPKNMADLSNGSLEVPKEEKNDPLNIKFSKKVGKDMEEHKKKMVATLRSIKLRKTGLLPMEEDDQLSR